MQIFFQQRPIYACIKVQMFALYLRPRREHMRARNAAYSTRDNAYRVMFVKSSSSLKNTRVREAEEVSRRVVGLGGLVLPDFRYYFIARLSVEQ